MYRIYSSKDFINGNFIKEIEPITTQGKSRKQTRRRGLFRCLCCGKEFIADLHNAERTQQKCCCSSCASRLKRRMDITHEEHPLYSRWLAMRQRCLNATSNDAINYCKRGITIEPYLQNFENYAEYVSSLPNYIENPSRNYQIDRIDNNQGYIRGNLRWVNTDIQSVNKRTSFRSKKYSKHIGVTYNKKRKKWVASVSWHGQILMKHAIYNTEEEAFEARKKFILDNNLPHLIE